MYRERAQLWIDALESDEFKQGKGVLHDASNNTYCCLGVLCEVAKRNGLSLKAENGSYDDCTYLPPSSVDRWIGCDYYSVTVPETGTEHELPWLNDHGGRSFKDIATLLRDRLSLEEALSENDE